MTNPPDLTEATKRKLSIKWDDLLAEARLTGEHLEWHTKAPKFGHVKVMMDGVDTGQRLSIPVKTDHIGVDPSVSVAKGRFRDLAQEYWLIWQESGTGWEICKTWLEDVKRQVLGELASLWKGRSDAIDRWYVRVCGPAIEDSLTKSVDERVKEARSVELRRLERSPSIPPIATADPISDDTPEGEAKETPLTGQRATPEMIETGEILEAISDFGSLNRVAPDDPSYEIWKDFYVAIHKISARFTSNQARQALERKPLDLNEFSVQAVDLFKKAAETQISLVTNLDSVGGCECELKKMMAGVLEIYEWFLGEFSQDRAASMLLADLRLNLLGLLANAKVRALEKSETFEREAVPVESIFEQAQGKAIVDLLLRVVERQNITIEGWAQSHRIGRTTVFDWKAARLAGKSSKGKVSDPKCAEIEKAIEEDAETLGLVPGRAARTDPD